MYLAEIHGKLSGDNENKEDILTSNVFSFFKYTNRGAFFYPLLRLLGFEVSVEDCKQAEFIFWPTYADRTQPDLVILVGRYYLLVEDKYLSGFGAEAPKLKHQLEKDAKGGLPEANHLGREFKILAITADYYRPPEIFDEIPNYLKNDAKWINWQSISFLIYKILKLATNLPAETKLFASDLYDLFIKKNLRNFEGMNALPNIQLSNYVEIFFSARTAQFRGDFIGFIQALEGYTPIAKLRTNIFNIRKQSPSKKLAN
jgi:hypothetical protein